MKDREFAERLQQRLIEKSGVGGKVEPMFKTTAAAKPAAAPQPPSPPRTSVEREPRVEAPRAEIRTKAPADDHRPEAGPKIDGARRFPGATTGAAATKADTPASEARPAPQPQPIPTLPLVMRAAQFAAERHKTQRRRGAAREPYVNHLLEVAALLATATDGRDPDLVIAGLLHDLIEDQSVSADDIARQFGVGVAALVLEVTTDKTLSDTERSRLQIAHAAHKSPRARMLRIADLTSNLRALRQSPPADWSIERQREYFHWAHDVVAGSRGISAPLDAAFDDAHGAGLAALNTAAEPATH